MKDVYGYLLIFALLFSCKSKCPEEGYQYQTNTLSWKSFCNPYVTNQKYFFLKNGSEIVGFTLNRLDSFYVDEKYWDPVFSECALISTNEMNHAYLTDSMGIDTFEIIQTTNHKHKQSVEFRYNKRTTGAISMDQFSASQKDTLEINGKVYSKLFRYFQNDSFYLFFKTEFGLIKIVVNGDSLLIKE